MLQKLPLGLTTCLLASLTLHPAWAAAPDTAKTAAPPSKAKKGPAAKALAVTPTAVELSPEHLAVADKVVLGPVACELGAKVLVRADSTKGRFVIELGREKFRMEPTLTTTGAVRLEDAANGVVWLQLGNKSMLLSQKLGKRLADACVNAPQSQVASALEQTKPPGLLDDAPAASPVAEKTPTAPNPGQ